MIEAIPLGEPPPVGVIPIHFDVPAHYLPLATFVETANQTRGVIDSFNREWFAGQLTYDLLVFPPEEGTFKTRLGIVLLAGWGVVWSFTESDVGKAFIKGLTLHEPSHWAEQIGTLLRGRIVEPPPKVSIVEEPVARASRHVETIIISESTKAFLQTDQSQLRRIGITPDKFREAFEARNRFYQACSADTQVRALGFEDREEFPIRRKDFARLIVPLAPREELPFSLLWQVEVVVLKVTSPNWDRDDRQRNWKGRDERGRERYFRIDDEHFWGLVRDEKLDPHIIDTMKVQWAYVGEQRRSARALRVLEYNGDTLGEVLDDNALAAMLGTFEAKDGDQGELFSGGKN